MKKLNDHLHLTTLAPNFWKPMFMGFFALFLSSQAMGQFSCDWQIESFTMTPDPTPPADPIVPGCTPLAFTIVLYNSDETLPTESIRLALTIDPAQFTVDPANNGGFTTIVSPSANPAFPDYIDIVQFVTLQPGEQVTIRFNAVVPQTFSTASDPTVDVRLFADPPATSACDPLVERIVFLPEVVRQIGSNGSTYFLGSVALDNPNDNVTVLDQLYSVPGGNPSNLPRQEAVIRGNMIVDIPYQFSATSKLVLAEDAQIVINNGAAPLTILGTDIRGCATLWEHLLATTGGNLTLSNSTVRDGRNAVHVTGAGIANISGNTFTDNDAALLAVGEAKVSFGGNTVNSVGALLPPVGNVQQRPRTGIELAQVTVPVTIGGTGANHFEDLNNGIVAFGTTLDVRNSSFKDIVEGNAPSLGFSGRGIHVDNAGTDRQLTQTGLGFAAGTATFDNCTHGVLAIGSNINVQQNRMVDVVVGIESQLAQAKDITIKFNDITASRTGINMFQNTRVRKATIEDNKVKVEDPATGLSNAIGIRCDENGGDASFAPQKYRVVSNTVEVKGGRSGISFSNASLALLKNNTVKNLLSSTYSSGIYIDGAYNTVAACNLLQGAGATSETRGLHAVGAYRTVARCNEATGHYLNINFEGATDNSALLGNKMGTAFHGFLLGSAGTPGMIGQQKYRGNKWTGGFTSFPAAFPSANTDQALANRFFINPGHQPYSQFHPTGVQPAGWFFDQSPPSGQTTFDCGSANSCPDGIGDEDYPEVLDDLDDDIADGDITSTFCTEAYKWTAQRHLYARLQRKPDLANGNTKMQNFMAAKSGTSIGQFEAIAQQVNQMLRPSNTEVGQLGSNRETVGTKLGEIQAIEAQICGGTLSTQQVAQKRAQQAQLRQEIQTLDVQSDGIVTNFNSQKSATALSLLQQNNAISATATYEQNQKQVNDIFLRTIARGHANFNATQLATLLSIADQCYICGGDGVFLARSMYALVEPARVYNDGVLCGGQLIKKEPEQGRSTVQFKVSPNPANSWALIESDQETTLEGEVLLFDVSGKLIRNESIVVGEGLSHLLDLSGLSAGFYELKIMEGGRKVGSERLIITR
jgi:hypothetical protein